MFENSTESGSRIPCGSGAPWQQDAGATLDKMKQKPPSSDDLMLARGHSLSKDHGKLTIFHQRTQLHLGVGVLDYNSFWRNQFIMSLWESMLDDSEFHLF